MMKFNDVDELKQFLCDMGFEDSVVFDSGMGYDYITAVVGVSTDGRVIYEYNAMVDYIVNQSGDGMTEEEAVEWIEYNTVRALPYAGENGPIIMYGFRDKEYYGDE